MVDPNAKSDHAIACRIPRVSQYMGLYLDCTSPRPPLFGWAILCPTMPHVCLLLPRLPLTVLSFFYFPLAETTLKLSFCCLASHSRRKQPPLRRPHRSHRAGCPNSCVWAFEILLITSNAAMAQESGVVNFFAEHFAFHITPATITYY